MLSDGRDAALRRPRTAQRAVPTRKMLPHEVPLWVDPSAEIYFVTICCAKRGENELVRQPVADELIDTIKYRNEQQIWYVRLAMLMPDHVHLLVSFPQVEVQIQTIISKWKKWTAQSLGNRWQRDFFEHRLRREESLREKADYILANPVRAGLAARVEDWPYVFMVDW